jgi:hypothetical protein
VALPNLFARVNDADPAMHVERETFDKIVDGLKFYG